MDSRSFVQTACLRCDWVHINGTIRDQGTKKRVSDLELVYFLSWKTVILFIAGVCQYSLYSKDQKSLHGVLSNCTYLWLSVSTFSYNKCYLLSYASWDKLAKCLSTCCSKMFSVKNSKEHSSKIISSFVVYCAIPGVGLKAKTLMLLHTI